ncbi:DNA repair protein XRCC3 isoform X2 [Rhopalosiphum padi]|uniref:DNA repair protein XRCC3 isoform X2 n=1 Tax=Rhopalosiphum padi TaxID=40932 RepID=UPI00298E63F4|nr:DNA repair protein XRCC3 isoform X2 [Rhopalosiphum padi]
MNSSLVDDDLDLNVFDPYTQAALIKGGFLLSTNILKYTEEEFRKKVNLTVEATRRVYIAAANISASNVKCHQELNNKVLTTGCIQIDKLLGGGLFKCGITEISGESGCGKTQFCLQIALTVQLPLPLKGAKSGAAYICTEDRFPSSRIQQMISNIRFKYKCDNKIDMNELCQIDYGDNILISHVATVEDLKKCIHEMLPKALLHRPIKLIIIDSITAVFRGEYTLSELPRRSRDLRDIAFFLHKLSVEHGLWIICVNQVTSSMSDNSGKKLVPSLGLSWANLVTTRLMMSRTQSSRYIEVMFSPHTASTSIPFRITEQGIESN